VSAIESPEPPVHADVDLSVRLGGLTLANPVGTASGTFGKGLEFKPFYDVGALGFVVVKTITLEPRAGNPAPRLAETSGGMLNSIGLPNPGIHAYVRDVLPQLRTLGAPLVINIAGHDPAAFAELARILEPEEGIDALELNMSCPNVTGGMDYSTSPEGAREVVSRVRDVTDRPLIAKLSPNVTDIRPIAVAAVEGGASAISAINTLLGMAVDWRRRRPVLGRGVGGLSGPCIKPVALRIVRDLWRAVDVPVIGIGGIQSVGDVMEYLVAGASAIQIGTANYYDPCVGRDIVEALPRCIREIGASSVREIVGTLEDPRG
jgi:dihydroorotate dehydrogenase (NAD+) catalytic subunit